jgi:hypothetical protein
MNACETGKYEGPGPVVAGMGNFVRRHLLAVSGAAVAALAAGAWLAFGYFGVHTLFFDTTVDEALPSFGAPAAATEPTVPDTAGSTAPDPVGVTVPDTAGVTVPEEAADGGPQVSTDVSGSFESLGRYRTVGTALVLGDGSGQRFLRFEDFETSNGPDLNVYLVNSSTGDVSDFVDLGNLRGNIGSQNYEIAADVDLAVYDTVMIWCVRFATGFGQSMLALV